MATITSPGLGSGLDINGLVASLVEVQQRPQLQRLDRTEAGLQARLSGFGSLKGALSQLQSSLASLKLLATYRGRTATSSASDILTATTTTSAAPGSYDISVTELAKAHKLATDPVNIANARFTTATDVVGTGTLTFKFGTTVYDKGTDTYTSFTLNPDAATHTVTITDGSLKGIRDAINDARIGVTASLINDGTYQRLALSVDETGAARSLEITVDDDDLNDTDGAGLSLLAFNSSATNLEQNQAAQNTVGLTIDGVAVSSAKNTLSDVIDGTTIKLAAAGTATLAVALDKNNVSSAVNRFVSKYNALITTINDLSKYDPETGEAGLLNGDGVLRSIDAQIRRVISDPIAGRSGAYDMLADVGITRDSSDGTLVLDNTKLGGAIDGNFSAIAALFAEVGDPSDALILFDSSAAPTKVGNYAVNISQLATQGTLIGSAAANLTITSGVNDTLTVAVDGVSATVSLTAGVYASAGALAAEVQSRINGAAALVAAGRSVKVSESGGVLTLTSSSYGASSTVSVSGGNGRDGLLGTGPTSTAGKDVAGTIGGVAAVGEGQYLIGDGAAKGLKLKIIGGATGARGTVTFTRGYAVALDDALTALLASDGIFTSVADGINDQLEDVNDQRAVVTRRSASFEERTRAQFIAMDALVAQLQTTSDFLTRQLAKLPTIGSGRTQNG